MGNAIEAIHKVLRERCSFNEWSDDRPKDAGDLLEKYGKDCNWSIRDKGYCVRPSQSNVIQIEWETEDVPVSPAIDMIKEAVSSCGIKDLKIDLYVFDKYDTENKFSTWSM